MGHMVNMLMLLGMIVGFPAGYFFCKWKYRHLIKGN